MKELMVIIGCVAVAALGAVAGTTNQVAVADVAKNMDAAQGSAEENARIGRLAYETGKRYAYGYGVERDLEKAFEYYLAGAEAGYVKAEAQVGHCYWNGEGTVRDLSEAAYWFERAALHGNRHSMFAMGIMRHFGLDGNMNCYEACLWFRAAAKTGYGNPGYVPDGTEEEGCGPEVSVQWIASAAEFGNNDALYWLAECYWYGQGVPCDEQMYVYLMQCAADKGESQAKCAMGCDKWYGRISGTRGEGLELVREAEKQGNISAYQHLEKLDKTGDI